MSETLEVKARRIGDDISAMWSLIHAAGGMIPHSLNTENLQDVLPQIHGVNKWESHGLFLYAADGNFYDFYTTHEVARMENLPDVPTGSDGWPMTLAQVQAALENSTYVIMVADGPFVSNFSAKFNLTSSSYLSPTITFKVVENAGDIILRWGDGAAEIIEGTGTITKTHTYSSTGEYTVTISAESNDDNIEIGYWYNNKGIGFTGGALSTGNAAYRRYVNNVVCGDNVYIGDGAFALGYTPGSAGDWHNSTLDTISIKNYPSKITRYMFDGCSMTEYLAPLSITELGDYAFQSCQQLTTFRGDSVDTIGVGAFSDCTRLVSASFSNQLTVLPTNCFAECRNLSYTIPSNITEIGDRCFYYCTSLSNVVLPSGLTRLGNDAFYGCSSMTGSLTVPAGVDTIGSECFEGTKLTRVDIMGDITGGHFYRTFFNLNNSIIVFHGDVTVNFGQYVFGHYNPSTVITQTIDFSNVSSVAIAQNDTFCGGNVTAMTVIVPDALYNDWVADTVWANFIQQGMTIKKASEV